MKQLQHIFTITISALSIILGLTFCYLLIDSHPNNNVYSSLSNSQLLLFDGTFIILTLLLIFFQIFYAWREEKKLTLFFGIATIVIIILHFCIDNHFTIPTP